MRVRLLPHKAGSNSARVLARELGVRRLRLVHTRFRPRPTDLIINWGNTGEVMPVHAYINHPSEVESAVNKLRAFRRMEEVGAPHVPFTANEETVAEWLEEGDKVVARTLTRASSGRGIVLIERGDPVVAAPLYTKYIKKRHEYRIHVARGQVFDFQQKLRRRGYEGRDNQIRNHHTGWVYAREGAIPPPVCVVDAALRAYRAFELDFCAVDVGYNEHYDQAHVYEVNTAPGLEGETLLRYAEMLRGLIEEYRV